MISAILRIWCYITENGNRRIVSYTQTGLLPDNTPCACCLKMIETEEKQKRVHILMGCGCKDRPLVCSKCRHKDGYDNILCKHYCQWCQKSGLVRSFIKKRGLKELVRYNAKVWFARRWQHQHVVGYLFQRVLANWNLFARYENIVEQEMVPNFQNLEQKVLAKMFFESWFQNQLKKTHCKISICNGRTRVDPYFLTMLRDVAFTRVAIRNLFRRLSPKTMSNIHSMVLARVLANFKIVFEFQLN